ncbi:MAG: ATP-binding protein, partial [Thermodesulfobacteriota bacterium]|nr:ATP-binding protein [Thermodesulfobacteriota bacterium]
LSRLPMGCFFSTKRCLRCVIVRAQKMPMYTLLNVTKKLHGEGQGTGLGLYIARCTVNAHGGDIWVKSEPGRGSDFSFTIPVF